MPKTNDIKKSYRILSIDACKICEQMLENGTVNGNNKYPTDEIYKQYKQAIANGKIAEKRDYKFKIVRNKYRKITKHGAAVGYKLPDKEHDESGYLWRFRNKLDASLDAIKLKKVYEDTLGAPFAFCDGSGNEYTLAVINVKFNGVYKFEDGDKEEVLVDCQGLRDILYKWGFYLGGVHYVRYKRSAGSSRQGNCLFIDDRLYDKMAEWGECGLSKKGDLASWEAYKALSLSSIKGTIDIPVEGILFVRDYKPTFKEEVVSVELQKRSGNNNKEENKLVAQIKMKQIENNIWDGESLLDESLFADDYATKHMLLLRNKFFKSCAFKTKLKKWIKDNDITLDGLKERGFTLATNIDQIVMVTTESSLKYLKFAGGTLSGEAVRRWADCVDSTFGVVKWDKRTQFFGGRMVRGSYQLFNTIGLDKKQVKQFMQPSKDYVGTIRQDVDFMRYHFSDIIAKENDCDEDDDRSAPDGIVQRAEVLFKLMDVNDDIERTKLYVKFRNDVVKAQRKALRAGRVLVSGTNATLFGNGPELLKYIAGDKEPQSELMPGQIRCGKFKHGQQLLCARSPHITMGNLYCVENNLSRGIWDYFDLGENIVCVNAIGENIQHRLNGCDYDSDAMLITDHPVLVQTAQKYDRRFKVPFCDVKSIAANHTLAALDHSTSTNKIGEIVNLSQKLNSIIWDRLNNGKDDIQDIYLDVCKLAALSGLEIDKAKKAYDKVRVGSELAAIKKKYVDDPPKFFKPIHAKQKKPKKQDNKQSTDDEAEQETKKKRTYDDYDTAMEYMYKAVNAMDFRYQKPKHATIIPLSQILNVEPIINPSDDAACEEVIKLCDEYKERINNTYKETRFSDESEYDIIYDRICEIKDERDKQIGKLITNANILYRVIEHCEKNNAYDWHIYTPLLNNKIFLGILKESKTKLNRVVENEFGPFTLYEFRYSKV